MGDNRGAEETERLQKKPQNRKPSRKRKRYGARAGRGEKPPLPLKPTYHPEI